MAQEVILPPRTGIGGDKNVWTWPNVVYKTTGSLLPAGVIVKSTDYPANEIDVETACGGAATVLVVTNMSAQDLTIKINDTGNDAIDLFANTQRSFGKNDLMIKKLYFKNAGSIDAAVDILVTA